MPTLTFLRRGQPATVPDVPPDRTLLELLRDDLHVCGTKEGCGEGDCGACTVVVGEPDGSGGLALRPVNACIRLAHSIAGRALWTVEDLQADPHIACAGKLHPAQEAVVQCHGSQCGFCTPGFVMSLVALHENRRGTLPISRADAQDALSGNLCRCTGYRPILDAAQQMAALPDAVIDRSAVLQNLEHMGQAGSWLQPDSTYFLPQDAAAAVRARAADPQAQVVAGCTDAGLWVTKQHRRFERVLDVSRVAEWRRIEAQAGALAIGAAVPLTDAFDALVATRPQLDRFAARFAGLPIRSSGTLGGNIANGSPIGDSMPLLIALDATLELASVRGTRTLPIEDFFAGYRKTVLAADELVARIHVPAAPPGTLLRADKVSKRFDDDISAVCLVVQLDIDGGTVRAARIGAGGVAAVPARARAAEAAFVGQPWSLATVQRAAAALQAEFTPLSDLRASAAYRRALLGNLLLRLWHEQSGAPALLALEATA